jgi:hypothetical protein
MSDDVSGLRTWMQQSLADPGDNIAKSVSDLSANENEWYVRRAHFLDHSSTFDGFMDSRAILRATAKGQLIHLRARGDTYPYVLQSWPRLWKVDNDWE